MTEFEAFMDSRQWQPIADYVQEPGEVVLFRWPKFAIPLDLNPSNFAVGYYGERSVWPGADQSQYSDDPKAMLFRNAQDHLEGEPLIHQPTEFALITAFGDMDADDWRAEFMKD